jgi:hypothetical protein
MLALACDGNKVTDTGPSDTGASNAEVPDIAVDVATLDFGSISPGSNTLKKLTIENRGDAQLNIKDFALDPDWGWVRSQLTTPFPISNIAPVEVFFECKPDIKTSGGVSNLSGTLRIISDDPDEPEIIVGIDCELLTDADNDGYESFDVGGDDCDDNDPSIYPDAPDEWYDGIDSNCDEADDFDQDKDGFRSVVYFEDTILPAGNSLYHPTKNTSGYHVGGDCQDNNPEIYPDYFDYNITNPETGKAPGTVYNANEAWYDGVDHNCDSANDYDQDKDGYSAEAHGRGSDCDDLDSAINPDNDEMLNGVDDDCDETIDQDVPGWNSDLVITGTDTNQGFGYAVVMGDLNDDGQADVIASAPGYDGVGLIAVYDGSDMPVDSGKGIVLTDGQNWFVSSNEEELGTSLTFLSDSRGNGDPDVAIGAAGYSDSYTNGGRVYVMSGDDLFYGGDLANVYLTIDGSANNQEVGAGLAPDAELNGDGVNDYIGRYTDSSNHALWLLYGGVQGTYDIDTVDATFSAEGSKETAKRYMSPTGDLNGDGYGDMVFCDHTAEGRLWVLWGSSTRYEENGQLSNTGTQLFIGEENERLGKTCGIGPDTDGDGDDELWVHVIDASDTYSGIYQVPGSTDLENSSQHPSDIYSHYYEIRGLDVGLLTFGNAGDWDNDGIDDVVFGLDKSGVSYGRVWIFGSTDAAGDYVASSSAYASVEGDDDAYQELYGSAIVPFGEDINMDGTADFVAGDSLYDHEYSLYPNAGAIYIHYQVN